MNILLECPPQQSSYVAWENYIEYNLAQDLVNTQQMPLARSGSPQNHYATIVNGQQLEVDGNASRKQTITTAGDSQPRVTVTIRGRASRIGYHIENPQILTVMGSSANFIQSKSFFSETILSYYNQNCPVYAGAWMSCYVVEFDTLNDMQSAMQMGFDAVLFKTPDVPSSYSKAFVMSEPGETLS